MHYETSDTSFRSFWLVSAVLNCLEVRGDRSVRSSFLMLVTNLGRNYSKCACNNRHGKHRNAFGMSFQDTSKSFRGKLTMKIDAGNKIVLPMPSFHLFRQALANHLSEMGTCKFELCLLSSRRHREGDNGSSSQSERILWAHSLVYYNPVFFNSGYEQRSRSNNSAPSHCFLGVSSFTGRIRKCQLRYTSRT